VRKRYPKYKDSGIEWLGEIPEHWEIKRLKYVSTDVKFSSVDKHSNEGEMHVHLCNYINVYNHEHIWPDQEYMEATATLSEVTNFKLKKGDVIVTKDSEDWRDIVVSSYVPQDYRDLLCGYHLALVSPDPAVMDGRYVARLLSSRAINYQYQIAATGITRYGLGKYDLDNSIIIVPPRKEQAYIAEHVEKEISKIDTLLSKKEKQVDLLKEKRAAVITRAVTKGLDPNVPMKDSGVEWLGEIPAHWQFLQIRRVMKKFVDYRGKTPEKVSSGIPLITAANVKNGFIDFANVQEYVRVDDYDEWMGRGLPELGDVLITTEAPLGEVAQINNTNIALAQRIIMFKVDKQLMINEYLKYFVMSGAGSAELVTRSTGSTALGIKAWHLKEILITIPPLIEQRKIIHYIDQETSNIDKLIGQIQSSIDKLKEYRSALISAAVTGMIDVRGD